MSHFNAGDREDFDGVAFRVVEGRKAPGDLRLEVQARNGLWRPVTMRMVFFLADFFFENEELLYPPPRYLGGAKFRRAVKQAMEKGYKQADASLQVERQRKDAQRDLWDESA